MKRKYIPDLTKEMAQCEANYMRLMKLMPDIEGCEEREFQLSYGDAIQHIRLRVNERFTYTSTVEFSLQQQQNSPWLELPSLLVRLYHDASIAEVVCIRRRQMSGVYPYPNPLMHQPDEKAQLNSFLAEWLSHCLSHGHQIETVFSGQ